MNKKIAYLVQHDITKNDGVAKKIKSQTDAWRQLGADVSVFCTVPAAGHSIVKAKQYESKGYLKQRLMLDKALLSDISTFNPDLVYFRYDTWSKTFSCLAKRYKIVCELNTLDIEEFRHLAGNDRTFKAWARYFAYKYLRKLVLNNATAIVSVTHEILCHPSNAPYVKQGLVVPNAIALDQYPTMKQAGGADCAPALFFIGTPGQPWHGVDVIEQMAENLSHCQFHIVGMSAPNKDNLFYYGYLSQTEYTEILKKCHICIGSLALYRNNMSEACPLKVREYLSYGYPVIVGYTETAFLNRDNPEWLLEVGRNIDYQSLSSFIEKNKSVVVESSELLCISVQECEKNRLDFLQNV